MSSRICCLFAIFLLLTGVLMCSLAITEFTTGRILNLQTESEVQKETPAVSTVERQKNSFVVLLMSLGPAFILYSGVIFYGIICCERHSASNNHSNHKKTKKTCFTATGSGCNHPVLGYLPTGWDIVEIPSETSATVTKEIENVLYNTWQYEERLGRDAANLKHKHLKPQAVYIVHNLKQIRDYLESNERLKASGFQKTGGRLMGLSSVKGQTEPLTRSSGMGEVIHDLDGALPSLCNDINEVYLFHGTKSEHVKGILDTGFSLDKASTGLYGKAIYFAESSEKSDQYADYSYERRSENLCMLLVRVALGRTYVHDGKHTYSLNSLPCTRRTCFTPGCSVHTEKFTSAVAGSGKRFREFLLYNPNQCLPHVLVYYDRIEKQNDSLPFLADKSSTPCYVIGPKPEVKHFKGMRKDHPQKSQTIYCLENEIENHTKLGQSEEAASDTKSNMKHVMKDTRDSYSTCDPGRTSSSGKSQKERGQKTNHSSVVSNHFPMTPSLLCTSRTSISAFVKSKRERKQKMDHVNAVSEHIPTTPCLLDTPHGSLNIAKNIFFKTRANLKMKNVKIDSMEETLKRNCTFATALRQIDVDEYNAEKDLFDKLFLQFNTTFAIWRRLHESCAVHKSSTKV